MMIFVIKMSITRAILLIDFLFPRVPSFPRRNVFYVNCSYKLRCFCKGFIEIITQAPGILFLMIFDDSFVTSFCQPEKHSHV